VNGVEENMDKLKEMVEKFPTRYWNDSCSGRELSYAIARGATGATTNPVIVKNVLDAELDSYADDIRALVAKCGRATEDEIAWMMIEKMAVDGARLLEQVFDPLKGEGRISIQTNTKYFRDPEKLTEQAVYFDSLAKNMQVKAPCTSAGIEAYEEMTYRGISVNATVSFCTAQALAVGEAIERGFRRREAEGLDVSGMSPVCTIMIGRLDDWLKAVVNRDNIAVDPRALEYAGIACTKKAYGIYREKGWRTKVLTAAYRSPLHWTSFIGGDMILTIPYKYQVRFNSSDYDVVAGIDDEVDPYYLKELRKLPDFVKGYDGMDVAEFDGYGPVNVTIEQFLKGYDDLLRIIRGFMVSY
jgi:transaldolase